VAEAVDGTALRLAAAVAVLVLVLDQLTKWLILEVVMQPPRVIEVTGFLNLVLVKNPGISFGLLGGEAAWKAWLLSALATGIVVVLAMWLRRRAGQRHRPLAFRRGHGLYRCLRRVLALAGFQRGRQRDHRGSRHAYRPWVVLRRAEE
jgi:hypothetical protein